jgi:sigma-B regulation protein RsbU (phosphoserine phosphatase)
VAVRHAPGDRPGGDFYDFLPLADGRLVFVVADASDEGGPSSMLVAILRVVLHSCPLNCGEERLPFCPLRGEVVQPPHLVLGNLNRVLYENSLEEQYVTTYCGLLSPAEGTLHYANAGHPAPRWWRSRTRRVEAVRDAIGLPLGLAAETTYHHKRIEIEPGDILVCYSDGLTAAVNARGRMYSTDQFDDALAELAPGGAEAVKDGLWQRFHDFLAGRPPPDDVTLVVLERQA